MEKQMRYSCGSDASTYVDEVVAVSIYDRIINQKTSSLHIEKDDLHQDSSDSFSCNDHCSNPLSNSDEYVNGDEVLKDNRNGHALKGYGDGDISTYNRGGNAPSYNDDGSSPTEGDDGVMPTFNGDGNSPAENSDGNLPEGNDSGNNCDDGDEPADNNSDKGNDGGSGNDNDRGSVDHKSVEDSDDDDDSSDDNTDIKKNVMTKESGVHKHLQSSLNKLVKCGVCLEEFQQKALLNLHMKSHSLEKPFQCHLCSKTFKYNSNFQKHLRKSHANKNAFKCILCCAVLSQQDFLVEHLLNHITVENEFKCVICSEDFTNIDRLKSHMRAHAVENLIECEYCEKSFDNIFFLDKHVLEDHPSKYDFSADNNLMKDQLTEEEPKSKEATRNSSCISEKPSTYIRRSTRKRTCRQLQDCLRQNSKTSRQKRKAHQKIVSNLSANKFVCNLCSSEFSCLQRLKWHMTDHLSEAGLQEAPTLKQILVVRQPVAKQIGQCVQNQPNRNAEKQTCQYVEKPFTYAENQPNQYLGKQRNTYIGDHGNQPYNNQTNSYVEHQVNQHFENLSHQVERQPHQCVDIDTNECPKNLSNHYVNNHYFHDQTNQYVGNLIHWHGKNQANGNTKGQINQNVEKPSNQFVEKEWTQDGVQAHHHNAHNYIAKHIDHKIKSLSSLHFRCHFCHLEYDEEDDLVKHIFTHSDKLPQDEETLESIVNIDIVYSDSDSEASDDLGTEVRVFECLVCCMKFRMEVDLIEHKATHEVKSYECHICKKSFKWQESLDFHMASHLQDKPFKCHVCSISFLYKHKLKQHLFLHLEEKFPQDLRNISNMHDSPFVSVQQINISAAEKLHTAVQELTGAEVSQSLTEQPLSTQQKKDHSIVEELNKSISLSFSSARRRVTWNSRDENIYECHICPKVFSARSKLKNHMVCHSDERPFKCRLCPRSFKHNSALKRHLMEDKAHRKKRRKQFQCHKCDGSFDYKKELKLHLITHSDKKDFQCGVCSKSYDHSFSLRRHMMEHTKKEEFLCKTCAKILPSQQDLKIHLQVHQKEKVDHHKNSMALKREPCQKKSTQEGRSILYDTFQEMNTDSENSKSLRSQHCEQVENAESVSDDSHGSDNDDNVNIEIDNSNSKHKIGIDYSGLKVSLNINYVGDLERLTEKLRGPDGGVLYKCKICDKSLKNKTIIKRHSLSHLEQRLFQCRFCLKKYKSPYSLKKHLVTSHQSESSTSTLHLKGLGLGDADQYTVIEDRNPLVSGRIRNEHSEERKDKPTTTVVHKCVVCKAVFDDEDNFLVHLSKHFDA